MRGSLVKSLLTWENRTCRTLSREFCVRENMFQKASRSWFAVKMSDASSRPSKDRVRKKSWQRPRLITYWPWSGIDILHPVLKVPISPIMCNIYRELFSTSYLRPSTILTSDSGTMTRLSLSRQLKSCSYRRKVHEASRMLKWWSASRLEIW